MIVWLACVYMHHMHAWCQLRPEEEVISPVNGVTNSCELQCRCWESNPGPLKKESLLLSLSQPSRSGALVDFISTNRISQCGVKY